MMGSTAPTDEMKSEHLEVHASRHGQAGGGMMIKEDAPKSRSTVTAEYISKQTPGLNPMQLIEMLPGVNTTSTDPLGLSGGQMSMRGLNQTQIGFTLEGFPINDIGSYAVYPQEIVDSENLRTINVAQGSADLDSPHISATGGSVDMYLRDPAEHFGGTVDGSYGSYNARRIFGRVDTGYIGHSNLKGFVSFSAATEHSWRGPGGQNKLHGETKWIDSWGDGNVVSFSLVGNQSRGVLFPTTSLEKFQQLGIYNTYSATWDKNNPNSSANGNYYQLHRNPFTNIYASAPSTFKLTDNLTLTETPYFWYGNGNGGGAYNTYLSGYQYGATRENGSIGQYNASNTKSMLLYNPSNTQTYRPGAVTKLTLHTGINRLMVGYWFEYSKQAQTGPYSLIDPENGRPYDELGGGQNLVLANGQTAEYRDTLTQTRIHTMFIDDSISLLHDRLTIDGGLKYTVVNRQGHNMLPDTSTGPYINGSWQEPLPAVAIRYRINNENQLFASSTTNFRIPQNSSLYDSGTYYKNGGYGTKANPNVKPEVSISEEFGWRYQGPTVMSSLTYFHYNFTNRLYTQVVVPPDNPGAYYSRSINGGGSHADGVDFEIGTRPILYHLRPYFSAEYVNARTDSNVSAGGSSSDFVFSKGKFAPQTPKYQFGFHLDYDDGHLFAGYGLKYVAKQYSTFVNDQQIPDYLTMNVNAGYRFRNVGPFKAPTLRLNIQNITDRHYLGFVNGTAANAYRARGVYGSNLNGSSTTFLVASPFFVTGSASVDF
ncbi:TonB-dependent receptor [Neoasaia chiangmaiensis NBRC 101099]|uniref:TonB-dependent receptor n=2 Tax=Neoasaia chiangmaiensis TaxID=320497 RepID=A0A1U9KVA8_9PROT|nr:TonB-dependent receptor [Neoasaia chiangmaiensis]AQS89550.1 TonB-dependent receptor [Neoasaia chiangmaiensis]GBR40665.1 TonB-dependent receptor [Neoasaia chiangmaiensis NBRC 101099]